MPIINDQSKMVRSNRSSYIHPTHFDGFDGGRGAEMLQDNAKIREAKIKVFENGEEGMFGAHDCDIAGRGTFTI